MAKYNQILVTISLCQASSVQRCLLSSATFLLKQFERWSQYPQRRVRNLKLLH